MSVDLYLEPTFRRDTLLLHAEERLRKHTAIRTLGRSSTAMICIGFAVENLEHVVNIVDGLAEVSVRSQEEINSGPDT